MVLKNASLEFWPKGCGDILTLFLCQHYAAEVLVDTEVIVEQARILREGLYGQAKRGPGSAMNRMAVSRSLDVRTCLVDCRV